MSRERTAAKLAKADDTLSPPRARTRKVWTPERIAEVCGYVEEHLDLASSCEKAGGSYEGLRDAMATDPEIEAQVRKSQATSTHALITHALACSGPDSKAPLWLIERLNRERYKPPKAEVESKSEHTGNVGGGIQILVSSVEELRKLAAPKTEPEDEE